MNKQNIKLFKIGGSVLDSNESIRKLVTCLRSKIIPGEAVIVHGGGAAINSWLDNLNIQAKFIAGQRVTDEKTMQVVQMVLSGMVNKDLLSFFSEQKINAIGISGRDCGLARAQISEESLGYVGKVETVTPDIIYYLLEKNILPVISPVCDDGKMTVINVNSDFFASRIAVGVGACELNFVTSTGGVLKDNILVDNITAGQISAFIDKGIVTAGMIPKLQAAALAKEGGVEFVRFMNHMADVG
ncbi:acetylglutamate kinase, partial [Elusimicrobiota bacterium]